MPKKELSTPAKIAVGVGFFALFVGGIALGTSMGNRGYRGAIEDLKDQIKEEMDKDKNSNSTSTTARVGGQTYLINFVE